RDRIFHVTYLCLQYSIRRPAGGEERSWQPCNLPNASPPGACNRIAAALPKSDFAQCTAVNLTGKGFLTAEHAENAERTPRGEEVERYGSHAHPPVGTSPPLSVPSRRTQRP